MAEDKKFDNTNSGALFVNERKEKDTHPDFTGRINVEGKDYWVSSWLKVSKAGKKFMSLAVNPIEPKSAKGNEQASFDDFDKDIPF
jgi:uncharacterized protein (DUF736 family)